MRILWIDDEVGTLRPLIELLEEEGYEVDTAESGREGLEKLRHSSYNVVFLDYKMPGMDGIEVLKLIRSFKPNIPVVMLTMMTDREIIESAIGQDVFDYIVKPVQFAQLMAVLNKLRRREIKERMAGLGITQTYNRVMSISETYEGWIEKARLLFETRLNLPKEHREVIDMEISSQNERFASWIKDNYPALLSDEKYVMSHNVVSRKILSGPLPVVVFLIDAFRIDQFLLLMRRLPSTMNLHIDFYMSLLPTSTLFARNSFFAGLLPLDIHRRHPGYLLDNLHEIELFGEFLKENHIDATYQVHKINDVGTLNRLEPQGRDIEVVVINFLDAFIHSKADIEVLREVDDVDTIIRLIDAFVSGTSFVEVLERYLGRGYHLVLTSDHGWVIGKKPIAIAGGRDITDGLRFKFGDSLRFMSRDGILVKNLEEWGLPRAFGERLALADDYGFFVYKSREHEYARQYRGYVLHGGISLEEMVVPLISISSR